MIEILEAASPKELAEVRRLIRAFMEWSKQLYPEAVDLVDQYNAAVETELAGLPGEYGPPAGRLLLAYDETEVAGMVALRKIDASTCEMKRLYVHPQFHGRGIGRALASTLIEQSRLLGYSSMRLDTGFRQTAAIGLYRRLGFQEIDPYHDVPEEMRAGMVFMELRL